MEMFRRAAALEVGHQDASAFYMHIQTPEGPEAATSLLAVRGR